MGMKFAIYYNVTKILEDLIKEETLYSYKDAEVQELYICSDTHVFWISRIYKDINEDFENEEGIWLIERNQIDKYDIINFIEEKEGKKYNVRNRHYREDVLDSYDINELIEYVIKCDDEKGMESWDNLQRDSLEECIEELSDGYGIEEL